MRPMVCAVSLIITASCGSFRYGLVQSYRALPITAEEFGMVDAYTAVVVPKPLQLHVSERGSAWLLLVRDAAGAITQHAAVAYGAPSSACGASVGTLLAVLPGDPAQFAAATGLLVAHDGRRCFGANGAPFPCAQRTAWQHAMVLQATAVPVREGSTVDADLGAWYARMLAQESVADANASVPLETLDDLAWEESVWDDVVDAIPAPIGAGIAAGLLSLNPVSGVVVAGVAYLVNLPYRLIADESGPEYGDAPMAASAAGALAEYLRQCVEQSAPAFADRTPLD